LRHIKRVPPLLRLASFVLACKALTMWQCLSGVLRMLSAPSLRANRRAPSHSQLRSAIFANSIFISPFVYCDMHHGNPDSPPAHRAMATPSKPAGWRLVNFARSSTKPHSDPQDLAAQHKPTPGWSAVHYDFEQRLSRFGIKVSEGKTLSDLANESVVQSRGGAHTIVDGYSHDTAFQNTQLPRDEAFPPLKVPTPLSLTNSKREARFDSLEQLLRQARAETQSWKEKCEARENDLHASYGEIMKWRMEYENLYSAVIRDQEIRPRKAPTKRQGTKSLG